MIERSLGNLLVVLGVALVAVGLALRFGLLRWFGRLPGDLRIEGESGGLYVPITSMLLVSLALSLVVWLVRAFGRGS